MPIFAHIETELELQLDDRTRLDASKSHTTLNQPAFTKLSIKPGEDAVAYSVYNSVVAKRYLDWEFSTWNIDIDSTNNKLDFKESGADLVATLTAGTYNVSQLATEIQTRMNAASTAPLVYTISIIGQDQIQFSATGTFSLLIATGANRFNSILNQLYLGSDDLSGTSIYTSETIESLSKKITTYAGQNVYQVQKVTCVADVAGSLNSKYFIIYAGGDADKYYVWYDVSAGGVDPSLAGFTGLSVAIATNDTAATIAAATSAVINAEADFDSVNTGSYLTITHTSYNWNSPVQEGLGSGFTFEVLTQGQAEDVESTYLDVYTIDGDYLFSNDADLMQFEPDIRKWIPDGRNSFLNVHRQAQKHILEWLDREGFVNNLGDKYTKYDFLDTSEVFEWSRFVALRMIFEGIKTSQDDVFEQKKKDYADRELSARSRALLRIRTNPDNTETTTIGQYSSTSLFRL